MYRYVEVSVLNCTALHCIAMIYCYILIYCDHSTGYSQLRWVWALPSQEWEQGTSGESGGHQEIACSARLPPGGSRIADHHQLLTPNQTDRKTDAYGQRVDLGGRPFS